DDPGAASARLALRTAINTLLRLFAPFLPYATEEVWSWCRTDDGALAGFESPSVHNAVWPTSEPLRELAGARPDGPSTLDVTADVLGRVRKAKSDAKASMRSEVDSVIVTDTATRLGALTLAADDLRAAGRITELTLTEAPGGSDTEVEVTLAEDGAASRT